MSGFDGVLLLGFGGPTKADSCACEPKCRSAAYCFVKSVLGPAPERRARIEEVAARYEEMGGYSPYNALTLAQAEALQKALAARGVETNVRVGMRHAAPRVKDAISRMHEEGKKRVLGVIMSPLRCHESWERYIEEAAEETAGEAAASSPMEIEFMEFWGGGEGYLRALAENIEETIGKIPADRRDEAAVVFTAHSIPVAASKRSPYVAQFERLAAELADRVGRIYNIAYQSGVYNTPVPWLEPDISPALESLAVQGIRDVVVAPVGFVCDHMEVLYDLDVMAKRTAERAGVAFYRAPTVGCHPAFIGMLAERAARRFKGEK